MKKIISLLLAGMMIAGLVACSKTETPVSEGSSAAQESTGGTAGMINPWTEQPDIATANKACGMNVVFPDELKSEDTVVRTMDSKMIQVNGKSGDAAFTFRAQAGDKVEDISGDYNTYAKLTELRLKGIAVFNRSNDEEKANTVYWNDGTNNYCIIFDGEVTTEVSMEVIDSLITANSLAY